MSGMIIRRKDALKLVGVLIIACCAVFVCTLFLNYNIDLARVEPLVTDPAAMAYYDASMLNGKVTSAISGGCLLLTSVVMLFFYIKHYIDSHKKELGILKALGYARFKIARGFWVFGLSVLIGSGVGFGGAFAILPSFYRQQNENLILPQVPLHFNPELLLFLVIIPALAFSILSVLYSYYNLKCPVINLLKPKGGTMKQPKHRKTHGKEPSFLKQLQKSTLRSKGALVFFITFASFCYAAMMQMAGSMDELASRMMAGLMMGIGLVLACTTLFLAITTVVRANTKTIAMMQAFGYSHRQCSGAILNGYRPMAYVGFAIGTVYQYALLKIMTSVVFKDFAEVQGYAFDWRAFFLVLISFAVIYEVILYCYSARMKHISLKEIMLE